MLLVRRQVDEVVRDRPQRDLGRLRGGIERPLRLAEDARQDPVADRRLVGAPLGARSLEPGAERANGSGFVLVSPERLKWGAVGLEGCLQGFHRQCEDLVGKAQPVAAGERGVRHEPGGARGAVDEGDRLLLLEADTPSEVGEEARQGRRSRPRRRALAPRAPAGCPRPACRRRPERAPAGGPRARRRSSRAGRERSPASPAAGGACRRPCRASAAAWLPVHVAPPGSGGRSRARRSRW
jgi:hypothetical protein